MDRYATFPRGLSDPADNAAVVTPSTDPLEFASRAIWVGTGGDLEVTMVGGQTVVLLNVPSGVSLPLRVTHVLAANTDADDIVAIW